MTVVSQRDALFADRPLEECEATGFQPVRTCLAARDNVGARKALLAIAQTGESRARLQAWHLLRQLGAEPLPGQEKLVLGVVVEVALPQGLDLLAAYADHTARYYNYSGAGVIWQRPDATLDPPIDALLAVGQAISAEIGPWEEARRPPPKTGDVRFNMLTPSGLHFGEGRMDVVGRDPFAGPLLGAATALMSRMTELGLAR